MKTAEEMANYIIGIMGKAVSASPADRAWLINNLAAYAEERVQETQDSWREHCSLIEAEARAEGRKEGYEDGKRDSIIEFCEGDHSPLAEYEQKAYVKGRKEGLEEAAKMADDYIPGKGLTLSERIRALKEKP